MAGVHLGAADASYIYTSRTADRHRRAGVTVVLVLESECGPGLKPRVWKRGMRGVNRGSRLICGRLGADGRSGSKAADGR